MIPVPDFAGDLRIRLVDALITLSGGVFAWGVFRFMEPRRFSPRWAVTRVVGTPVLWVVLVGGLAVFLCRWHQAQENQMEERMNQTVQQIAQA